MMSNFSLRPEDVVVVVRSGGWVVAEVGEEGMSSNGFMASRIYDGDDGDWRDGPAWVFTNAAFVIHVISENQSVQNVIDHLRGGWETYCREIKEAERVAQEKLLLLAKMVLA